MLNPFTNKNQSKKKKKYKQYRSEWDRLISIIIYYIQYRYGQDVVAKYIQVYRTDRGAWIKLQLRFLVRKMWYFKSISLALDID